jgi:hypothetical protein
VAALDASLAQCLGVVNQLLEAQGAYQAVSYALTAQEQAQSQALASISTQE